MFYIDGVCISFQARRIDANLSIESETVFLRVYLCIRIYRKLHVAGCRLVQIVAHHDTVSREIDDGALRIRRDGDSATIHSSTIFGNTATAHVHRCVHTDTTSVLSGTAGNTTASHVESAFLYADTTPICAAKAVCNLAGTFQ